MANEAGYHKYLVFLLIDNKPSRKVRLSWHHSLKNEIGSCNKPEHYNDNYWLQLHQKVKR